MEIPSEAIVELPLILATTKFPLVATAIVKNVSPTVEASSEIVTEFGCGQRCGWEGQTDCLGRMTGQEGRGREVSLLPDAAGSLNYTVTPRKSGMDAYC